MNTIKIYLAESGRIADLHKDFPLYQGQFQDKLLNVYVPTSILAPSFEIQHYIGQISGAVAPTTDQLNEFVVANTYPSRSPSAGDVIEFYNTSTQKFFVYTFSTTWGSTEVDSFGTLTSIAGTSIKIGMITTKSNGIEYKSKSYFMRYLKTLTYNNVEYALYERKLPKEFTKFAGQGQNAPILIANVVNIDNSDNTVTSIITSQSCALDVMKSTILDQDDAVEAGELELLTAQVNTLSADVALKQDKIDNSLTTTSKSVVGGINELNSQTATNTADIETNTGDIVDIKAEQITQNENIGANTENIATNTGDISSLKNRVSTIEQTMTTGENYVGTLTGASLPTSAQLTDYVTEEEGRAPKNGDTVLFILEVSQGTDKNYKYIYGTSGWSYYEIPASEKADNSTYGILKGTYSLDSTVPVEVDISGGEISTIYVIDGNGTKRALNEYLNTTASTLSSTVSQVGTNTSDIAGLGNRTGTLETNYGKILSGETEVGLAKKAEQDGIGNNIVSTYLTQNAGVTKQQMKDYALPREFNDVSFLTADGFSDEVPSTADPIISVTTSSIQPTTMFVAEKTFSNVEFELTQKNSYTDFIMIAASDACTATFTLYTEVYDEQYNSWTTLNAETSSPVTFAANTIQKVTFTSTLNYISLLHLNVIEITDGSKIRQYLMVTPDSSAETTFDIYSNATYPSQFFLNTTGMTVMVAQGYMGQIIDYAMTGDTDAGGLFFEFPSTIRLHNDVVWKFTLTYPNSLDDGTAVRFIAPDNHYHNIQIVTPYNYESAAVARLGDLKQVCKVDYSANSNKMSFVAVYKNDKFSVIIDDLTDVYYNKTKENVNTSAITWKNKTWTGLTGFSGDDVWTDGENIYYSGGSSHYVLDKPSGTWSETTWTGLTNFYGRGVWTSGRNVYYSYGGSHYVLDIPTRTWSQKSWTINTSAHLSYLQADRVWSDGVDTYFSYNSVQYKITLISGTETERWTIVPDWTGISTSDFTGAGVWSDGVDTYYKNTLKLIKGTHTWVDKTWTGLSTFSDGSVWHDGFNTYISGFVGGTFKLNGAESKWEEVEGIYAARGDMIWSDGDNIYFSNGDQQLVLSQAKTVRPSIGNNSTVNKINALNLSINSKESISNKVTSLSAASTDTEYPSAKCVYDLVGDINTILTQLNSGSGV